jgi:uncharacterized caspase-like protein
MHRSNFPIILIVALVFAAIGVPSPAWAKRVALVIGIDQYDNLKPDQQLKKAVNDSRTMGEALRSLGYEVQEAENVSRLDLLRQWQRFLNGVDAGDEAALYFAGHGVEIDGLNFLLPKDVPRVASGEEEVLKASALSLNGFLDQVRERKPQTMIFVVDACRDNPFTSSTGRSIGRTRGLTLVEPPSGTFVMFSAGAGETALDRMSDDDDDPNSVYTRVLAPRLKAPGKIGDIARDVRRSVRQLASRVNHVQTPAFYDELIGDFCPAGCVEARVEAREDWLATRDTESVDVLKAFIVKHENSFYAELAKARAEDLKRKRQAAAAASQHTSKPLGPDPAHQAWGAIQDTQNMAVLEAFVGKYPLSFYAELARVRLEELKRAQQAALVAAPPPPLKAKAPGPDPAMAAWNATKDADSEGALEAFIGNYPKSFYADLARARLAEIKKQQQLAAVAPARKDTAPDPSIAAWKSAQSSDSASVLQAFVDRYPDSFYAEVARAKIEALKRKEQEASGEAMVREVQDALKDLDCYDGPIDGLWGRGSRAALDRFARLAKIEPIPEEPVGSTLASLKAWDGAHCAVVRKQQAAPVIRERAPAKAAKSSPASPKATSASRRRSSKVRSAEKPASEKKRPGFIEDFDSGSVYCHQGCAGGFTNVMKGTATNPGMKR